MKLTKERIAKLDALGFEWREFFLFSCNGSSTPLFLTFHSSRIIANSEKANTSEHTSPQVCDSACIMITNGLHFLITILSVLYDQCLIIHIRRNCTHKH
jgi:hypothetical protein